MRLLVILLTLAITSTITIVSSRVIAIPENTNLTHSALIERDDTSSPTSFFSCELPFTSVYPTLIQISIHVMSFVEDKMQANTDTSVNGDNSTTVIGTDTGEFVLKQIDYNSTRETLEEVGLNSSLPFVFFINGFLAVDGEGSIQDTWMHGVAKSYARRKIRDNFQGENEKNVVFIAWSLPSIWGVNPLNVIPSYLKTMAYYDRILNFVTETIKSMIDFVEQVQSESSAKQRWKSDELRQKFYGEFQFYGHSLGAHLITDAVLEAHKYIGGKIKFGKLMGLDPANPCFLNLEHGLSLKRMAESVDLLVVLHSNAGFAGLTSERADMEIVLNGGTFQPGCSWYNFSCSHARVVDVLRYIDDECQMVAYKCSSYQQFKIGACETCESRNHYISDRWGSDALPNRTSPSCALVNLPEQHQDSEQILSIINDTTDEDGDGHDDNDHIRQLADNVADGNSPDSYNILNNETNKSKLHLINNDKRPMNSIGQTDARLRKRAVHSANLSTSISPSSLATITTIDAAKTAARASETTEQSTRYNHYVNTNANFRTGRKTHCLQHYQLRLLVKYQDDEIRHKCPIGSFKNDKILLSLSNGTIDHNGGSKLGDSDPIETKQTGFENVIEDTLFTSLLNFVGEPRLFVSAIFDNFNTSKLVRCLRDYEQTKSGFIKDSTLGGGGDGGLRFVLDIAFMSHVNKKVRHAFSSVLCGQLNSISDSENGLDMQLCRQAELSNVSAHLDELIDEIKDQPFYESWKLSLLNSLFSLFAHWEPF